MIFFKIIAIISPYLTLASSQPNMCDQFISQDDYLLSLVASFLKCSKSLGNFALTCKRLSLIARRQKLYVKSSIENMIIFSKYANVYSFSNDHTYIDPESSDLEKLLDIAKVSSDTKKVDCSLFPSTLRILNMPYGIGLIGVSHLVNIRVLNIKNHKTRDFSFLKDLKSLRILDLSRSRIRDASGLANLQNLHTLVLSDSKIVDISDLAKLKSLRDLDLSCCQRIKDYSTLCNITGLRELFLSDSIIRNRDLAAILDNNKNLHTLDISACMNITKISAPSNLHSLYMNDCINADNISPGNLHTLFMNFCPVTNVSTFGNLFELSIVGCSGVTDVSTLGDLHTLDMSDCYKVTDVSSLGGLHTLSMDRCTKIVDVSPLKGLTKICMDGCTGVTDISFLANVPTVVTRPEMCYE